MNYPREMAQALLMKANSITGINDINHLVALNRVAGTKGLELVGVLNIIAGNPTKNYREHDGVLNQLAGTNNWGANAAASRWAGLL